MGAAGNVDTSLPVPPCNSAEGRCNVLCRANAQQPKLFVGMILILIFAEALALYGLIGEHLPASLLRRLLCQHHPGIAANYLAHANACMLTTLPR